MCSRRARRAPLVLALLPLLAAQQQPPSLVSLLEVLRQHPDNPGAHNNVGLALKAAGDLQAVPVVSLRSHRYPDRHPAAARSST